MGFEDFYRLGAHAVISNERGEVLMLKATYGALGWSLPGGALDRGETIHECVRRECLEELGQDVKVGYLTGVYYINAYNSQCFIFRCELAQADAIRLSSEHSEYRYFAVSELGADQRRRVEDCLGYEGTVMSDKF
jgi:8-oxo-dGTP diphosphatase